MTYIHIGPISEKDSKEIKNYCLQNEPYFNFSENALTTGTKNAEIMFLGTRAYNTAKQEEKEKRTKAIEGLMKILSDMVPKLPL